MPRRAAMSTEDHAKFEAAARTLQETQNKVQGFVATQKKVMAAAHQQHIATVAELNGDMCTAPQQSFTAARQEQQVPDTLRRAGEGGQVAVQRCARPQPPCRVTRAVAGKRAGEVASLKASVADSTSMAQQAEVQKQALLAEVALLETQKAALAASAICMQNAPR